jgi:hypothetical protein
MEVGHSFYGGFPFSVLKYGFSGDIAIINYHWQDFVLLFFQLNFWLDITIWCIIIYFLFIVIRKFHHKI